MRSTPNLTAERYRVRAGPLASSRFDGNNGHFEVPHNGARLLVIASDGLGWDHVSVSLLDRVPTWAEMAAVKDVFFGEEETVWEYHPPRSAYVNDCTFALHLWKKQDFDMPLPPAGLI